MYAMQGLNSKDSPSVSKPSVLHQLSTSAAHKFPMNNVQTIAEQGSDVWY